MNDAEIIQLYNDGYTIDKIANLNNRSSRWVSKILHKYNTKMRPARNNSKSVNVINWDTKEERNRLILELYQKNIGSSTIAKMLQISKKTILCLLKEHNLTRNKTISFTEQQIIEINELYNKHHSTAKIATMFNSTAATVGRYIKNIRTHNDGLSIVPAETKKEIISKYVSGHSTYELADEYGYNYQLIQNLMRRNNVNVGSFTQGWKDRMLRGLNAPQSKLEKKLQIILIELGLIPDTQKIVDDFKFDFAIGNILIEVQGAFWHGKKDRMQRDIFKRSVAKKHGYKLIVIWEHEIQDINLIDLVKARIMAAINPSKFDFSKCNIALSDWTESATLLKKFHYQGTGRNGISIGAYHDSKLIATAVFCVVQRKEIATLQNCKLNEISELSRFCINPQSQSKNFGTWFLSRAIKLLKAHKPELRLLVSFTDPTFGHTGTLYRANNWIYDGESPASYWYYHRRSFKVYHKKTIWNKAKLANMPEEALAKKLHLIKVLSQPKMRFLYKLR